MKDRKIVLSSEILYCHHLEEKDTDELKHHFMIAHKNGGFLADYVKFYAKDDEDMNLSRTYLVRDSITDEIVAYFSLKAGFVSVNEKKHLLFSNTFDSEPGVEVSNFAISGEYLREHPEAKGVGSIIFYAFILPIVKMASNIVGISIIYIFALPYLSLINRYESYGFSRLESSQEKKMHKRIRPRYDKDCIFMFQKI